jgi:multiple sugar transport system permease protein
MKQRWQRLRRHHGTVAVLFLLPAGFGFVLFYLWPAVRALWMSFTDYNLLTGSADFVGSQNYRDLVADDLFWHSMQVTAWYVVLNIGSQTILALAIAVMMDRLTQSVIVRGILLLPWMIPQVVIGLLWLWLLDPRLGVVNHLIELVGGSGQPFLGSTGQVVPTLAGINTWRFMGYTALLLFAGLQMIPRYLYEAAALDGAGEWRMFWRVTMPLLRPVLALVLVLSVVGSFQVFDLVQVASGGVAGQPGGPANSSLVIYVYIFRQAFNFNNSGYAAAMGAVLALLLAAVTFLIMRGLRGSRSDLA